MTPVLRHYQSDVVTRARRRMMAGKRGIVQGETGSGKSIVIGYLTACAYAKGSRVLILADRRRLISQLSGTLDSFGVQHGIVMSGESGGTKSNVILASRDTLDAWQESGRDLAPFDLILIDECFTGETLVSTPMGEKRIGNMRCGDTVYCASGIGVVERVSCQPSHELYRLEFSDGTAFTCTGNHPVFTDSGWTKASAMVVGSFAYSIEDVRLMWENVSSLARNKRLPVGEKLDEATVLLSILCKEICEPDEQSSISPENESKAKRNKTQAYQAWRERAIVALGSIGSSARAGGRVGVGGSNSDRTQSMGRIGIPDVLQNRHSKSRDKGGDRAGRKQPHNNRSQGTGCEENGVPGRVRLVSISHSKSESPTPVFNLSVRGHPSYFANGKLVHNCHKVMGKTYLGILSRYPNAFVIGFTATPARNDGKSLGDFFQWIECTVPASQLIREGWLIKPEVYAPLELAEKRKKGDPTKGMAGDPVSHWRRHADGLPTIAFSNSLGESNGLCERFTLAGIPAETIEASTSDDERDAKFKRLQRGTNLILCSVGLLIEGVDIPEVAAAILWKKFGSLVQYRQGCGRIMRPAPGKTRAVVLDHAGAAGIHGLPGDDVEWSLDLTSSVDNRRKKAIDEGKLDATIFCKACGIAFSGQKNCPACGWAAPRANKPPKPATATYEARDEVLSRFEADQNSDKRRETMQRDWRSFICIAIAKGGKAGMAAAMFQKKHKVAPWIAGVNPLPDGSAGWKAPASHAFPSFARGKA